VPTKNVFFRGGLPSPAAETIAGSRGHSLLREDHPAAIVVVPAARLVLGTARRATEPRHTDPRSATQDTASWIALFKINRVGFLPSPIRGVPVPARLEQVAVHVVQPPRIGLEGLHRGGLFPKLTLLALGTVNRGSVVVGLLGRDGVAPPERGLRFGPTGVFP